MKSKKDREVKNEEKIMRALFYISLSLPFRLRRKEKSDS